MGQKVNPTAIRLGIVTDWTSKWYAQRSDFAKYVLEDTKVKDFLKKKLYAAGVSEVKVERLAKNLRVLVKTARPGVIIGKGGKEVENLKNEVSQIVNAPVHLTIEEVRKPEIDAQLVAESVAQQLERRVMFRRAMKRAVSTALKAGALGVKISVSGRLGGAEIARTEWYREGRVPLQTFRADIDYALAEAKTTYGIIGVKVWIFKGEQIGDKESAEESSEKGAKQEK